jgi:hypothetical protein
MAIAHFQRGAALGLKLNSTDKLSAAENGVRNATSFTGKTFLR